MNPKRQSSMRAQHIFNPISPVFRRFQGFCAIAIYVVALIGLPVPETSQAASDGAYPCQQGRCGCATAEQCWRSCCCHTLDQRVAWARAHGVTPPAYVLEQLASQRSPGVETANEESCCEHSHQDSASEDSSCERQTASNPSDDHPEAHACCGDTTESPTPEQPAAPRVPWVSFIDAAKCQGLQSFWIALGGVIPPPPAIDYVCELNPAGFVTPALQPRYEVSFSPPLPPPRA